MVVIETKHGTKIEAPDCMDQPDGCSWIRVVTADGQEVAYWSAEEFAEDPIGVLGAFVGAVRHGLW